MWGTVGALVTASSIIQVAHAHEATAAATGVQLGVALAVGALPPVVVLVAAHAWLDLAVASAPTKARRAAARTTRPLPATATPAGTDRPAPVAPPRLARSAAPTPTTPVTDEVVAEALRIRDAEPGIGWGTLADRLGVSKTSLQRRAKIVGTPVVVDLAA